MKDRASGIINGPMEVGFAFNVATVISYSFVTNSMEVAMYCRRCGAKNDDNTYKCVECGRELHPPLRDQPPPAPYPPPPQADDGIPKIVPYRNQYALIAYYMGVFSIIPCLGIILGIPAFFLGIAGLKKAKESPESYGKVHAWVGIIAGGLFGFS